MIFRCESWVMGLLPSSSGYFNVQYSNGQRYLLPSIWDESASACTVYPTSFLIMSTLSPNNYGLNQAGWETTIGSYINMWNNNPAKPGDNSLFHFTASGAIVTYHGKLCLDSNPTAGQIVQQNLCNGLANQKWVYNPTDKSIRPFSNQNLCVSVENGAINNGARPILNTCSSSAAAGQGWLFVAAKPVTVMSFAAQSYGLNQYAGNTANGFHIGSKFIDDCEKLPF